MNSFPTNICNWMDAFICAVEKSGKLADIRNFIHHKRLPKADPATAAGTYVMVCSDDIDKVINSNCNLGNNERDRKLVEKFFAELVEQGNNKIKQGLTKVEIELCNR